MKKQTRLTAVITAVTLAGSIQVLAAQDDTDTRTNDTAAVEVAPSQQSATTETPVPVATVPLEVQMPSQTVAVESMLSEMKIYPSF